MKTTTSASTTASTRRGTGCPWSSTPAAPVLGGPMSVYWSASGESGRQGPARDSGAVSQAAQGRQLRVGGPGPGAGDLSAGAVGGAGHRASEPAAWTGSPGAVAHPLSTIGSVRARRPGAD